MTVRLEIPKVTKPNEHEEREAAPRAAFLRPLGERALSIVQRRRLRLAPLELRLADNPSVQLGDG